MFIDPFFLNWTSFWLAIDPIGSALVTVVVIDPGFVSQLQLLHTVFTTVASLVLQPSGFMSVTGFHNYSLSCPTTIWFHECNWISYCSSLTRLVSHLALICWPLMKFFVTAAPIGWSLIHFFVTAAHISWSLIRFFVIAAPMAGHCPVFFEKCSPYWLVIDPVFL